MAVGMDKALRPPLGMETLRNPQGAAAAPQPQQATFGYGARPPAISDSTVQSAVNNQLASGFGAREMALSDATRRGISRGKGQQYAADMAQEAADAQASAAAAQTQMSAAASNSAAEQAYDTQMRGERLANESLLAGLRNSQAMEKLAKQGWSQNMFEAIRKGQMGLDSMYLDYTPLLSKLFD